MEEANCLGLFRTASEQRAPLLSSPRSYGRADGEDGEQEREKGAEERRDEHASHSVCWVVSRFRPTLQHAPHVNSLDSTAWLMTRCASELRARAANSTRNRKRAPRANNNNLYTIRLQAQAG